MKVDKKTQMVLDTLLENLVSSEKWGQEFEKRLQEQDSMVAFDRELYSLFGSQWKIKDKNIEYEGHNGSGIEFTRQDYDSSLTHSFQGALEYGLLQNGGIYVGFGEKTQNGVSLQHQRVYVPSEKFLKK